jgi:hypothetical protein
MWDRLQPVQPKSMNPPSEKQLSASRANGSKSRGPVTPEGRRNSSRNSLRHGLFSPAVVLDNESQRRFKSLIDSLFLELQPETHVEAFLIEKMAAAQWRQIRSWGLEQASISHQVRNQDSALLSENAPTRDAHAVRTLPRGNMINQQEMRFDRQYKRALECLLKLRAARNNFKIDETNPVL